MAPHGIPTLSYWESKHTHTFRILANVAHSLPWHQISQIMHNWDGAAVLLNLAFSILYYHSVSPFTAQRSLALPILWPRPHLGSAGPPSDIKGAWRSWKKPRQRRRRREYHCLHKGHLILQKSKRRTPSVRERQRSGSVREEKHRKEVKVLMLPQNHFYRLPFNHNCFLLREILTFFWFLVCNHHPKPWLSHPKKSIHSH